MVYLLTDEDRILFESFAYGTFRHSGFFGNVDPNSGPLLIRPMEGLWFRGNESQVTLA